ncbi:hypothetical protein DFS34DRAFT_648226 [Phlyctochytrium arcticum]|nr:hypothetical protein DFS34DRAFT_648226 [Phlyctochytrium arcticum]
MTTLEAACTQCKQRSESEQTAASQWLAAHSEKREAQRVEWEEQCARWEAQSAEQMAKDEREMARLLAVQEKLQEKLREKLPAEDVQLGSRQWMWMRSSHSQMFSTKPLKHIQKSQASLIDNETIIASSHALKTSGVFSKRPAESDDEDHEGGTAAKKSKPSTSPEDCESSSDNEEVCITKGLSSELENWQHRYDIILAVSDGKPFHSAPFADEHLFRTVLNEETAAADAWNTNPSKKAWLGLFDSPEEDHSASDEDFLALTPVTFKTSKCHVIDQTALAASLAELSAKAVSDRAIFAVSDVAVSFYHMAVVGFVRNILADDGTLELEYRSSFLDRLFRTTLASNWCTWRAGEVPNGLTSQAGDGNAQPHHDGIGMISTSRISIETFFFRMRRLAAMALSLDRQRAFLDSATLDTAQKASAQSRLMSFGIVVAQRNLRIYVGKWHDQKTVIMLVKEMKIPSTSNDWSLLGSLIKELMLVRERLGFLYNMLRKLPEANSLAAPASKLKLTPKKPGRRTSTSKVSKSTE